MEYWGMMGWMFVAPVLMAVAVALSSPRERDTVVVFCMIEWFMLWSTMPFLVLCFKGGDVPNDVSVVAGGVVFGATAWLFWWKNK